MNSAIQTSRKKRKQTGFVEADGRIGCAGRPYRLHEASHPKIVPYVKQPEEIVPGKPLFYATAMPMGGVARACWWKATWAGRPRSKAIRITQPAWARPMYSRRLRY